MGILRGARAGVFPFFAALVTALTLAAGFVGVFVWSWNLLGIIR